MEDQHKDKSSLEKLLQVLQDGEYKVTIRNARGLTGKKLVAALDWYIQTGNLVKACKRAKINRHLVYFYVNHDPEFRELFETARAVALLELETEAYRRAVHGVLEPVYQKGELVGHVRKYDTQLLIFLMKNLMRDRFGEKVDITQHHDFTNAREEVEKALKRIVGTRKKGKSNAKP